MVQCIDLFCGVGGLSYGLKQAGIRIVAGVDLDVTCRWPYEANVGSRFIGEDVARMSRPLLNSMFATGEATLLAGCAPCQPFSTYSRTRRSRDDRWRLLVAFGQVVRDMTPDFVTMENVDGLCKTDIFSAFLARLHRLGYRVAWDVLACEQYGVPQRRRRLVLVAARHGCAELPVPERCVFTVRDSIGHLPAIAAGEASPNDRLHVAARLTSVNLKRIRHSRPGGTWRDWPENLIADCHRRTTGRTYPSVYGRMEWDEPSPTITTQCYGYGNGRFGHPEQDRAISLREAALLQSFPESWRFVPSNTPIHFSHLGRMIGNAVPPKLGEAIGRCIINMAMKQGMGFSQEKVV